MNMLSTIIPKSDQLNSDDLIGVTKTIKVTKVHLTAEGEQPVAVYFEGDNGKPYKPCKSMRRVMVNIWGPDAAKYTGRSMTLYRDDKVSWGGQAVGGIRISHMSDIDKDVTMALTASKAQRKPFTVRPLVAGKSAPKPDFDADKFVQTVETTCAEPEQTADALKAWWDSPDTMTSRKALHALNAGRAAMVKSMVEEKIGELAGGDV